MMDKNQLNSTLPFDKAHQLGRTGPSAVAAGMSIEESLSLDQKEIDSRFQHMMASIQKEHAAAEPSMQTPEDSQNGYRVGHVGPSQEGYPVRSLLEPDLVYRSHVPQRNVSAQELSAMQDVQVQSASFQNVARGVLPQNLLNLPSVTDSKIGDLAAQDHKGWGNVQPLGEENRGSVANVAGDNQHMDASVIDEIGRRLLAVNSVAQAVSLEVQEAQHEAVSMPYAGFADLVDELIKRCELMERQALEREELAKELETIQLRLQHAQAEQKADFDNQLHSLRAECRAFKHTRDEAEMKHEEYREWKRTYTPAMRQQLAARVQQLALERKTLAAEVANLKAQEQKEASAVDNRITRLKTDLSKVRREALEHENLGELLAAEVIEVEQELSKCESETKAAADAYREEIEEEATIKKEVEEARAETQTLKTELERSEKSTDSVSFRKEMAQMKESEEQESTKSENPAALKEELRRQRRDSLKKQAQASKSAGLASTKLQGARRPSSQAVEGLKEKLAALDAPKAGSDSQELGSPRPTESRRVPASERLKNRMAAAEAKKESKK